MSCVVESWQVSLKIELYENVDFSILYALLYFFFAFSFRFSFK